MPVAGHEIVAALQLHLTDHPGDPAAQWPALP